MLKLLLSYLTQASRMFSWTGHIMRAPARCWKKLVIVAAVVMVLGFSRFSALRLLQPRTVSGNTVYTRPIAIDRNLTVAVPLVKEPSKLIFLTYMRSGSTFIGELLHKNPGAVYWFEPLDGLYRSLYLAKIQLYPMDISHYANTTARKIPQYEHDFLSNNLLSILNCDYSQVAVDTLFSKRGLGDRSWLKFWEYQHCLNKVPRPEQFKGKATNAILFDCQTMLRTPCSIENFARCRHIIQSLDHHRFSSINKTIASQSNLNVQEMRKRHKCLRGLVEQRSACHHVITPRCHKAEVRAIKVIRLTMQTVQTILEADPAVKVIHLVRDPRGIVHSRQHTLADGVNLLSKQSNPKFDSSLAREASVLCQKMMNNLQVQNKLQQQYPNSFLQVRYEDLTSRPIGNYINIYKFLNIDRSKAVEDWISSSTKPRELNRKEDSYGTWRGNATQTASKWRSGMSEEAIARVTHECRELLDYLKYS